MLIQIEIAIEIEIDNNCAVPFDFDHNFDFDGVHFFGAFVVNKPLCDCPGFRLILVITLFDYYRWGIINPASEVETHGAQHPAAHH